MENSKGSNQFMRLLLSTNLVAACITVFVVSDLYNRGIFCQDAVIDSRGMQECCGCTDPTPTIFDCPLTTEGSVDYFTSGFITINKSNEGKLCTLVEVTTTGYLKPMGRSYDANNWEPSAGDYSALDFKCNGGSCSVDLPVLEGIARYQLTSFDAPPYSSKDIAARFLEQTTFGPTLADISAFDFANLPLAFARWIKNQQTTVPLTSHREYYRRRMNTRFEVATSVGVVTHPCQSNTRYRKFAFAAKDFRKVVTIKTVGMKTIISIDDFVRTVVDGPVVSALLGAIIDDGRYTFCGAKNSNPHSIGGALAIQVSPTNCAALRLNGQVGNPAITFGADATPNVLVSIQNEEVTPIDQKYNPGAIPSVQELLVVKDLTDPICASLGEPGNPVNPVFALYKNEYWIHDPRFETFDNTLESPAADGGGKILKDAASFENTAFSVMCANAPQTFLNDETCVLSDQADACMTNSANGGDDEQPKFLIPADHTALRAIYDVSGGGATGTIYMYAVDGLRVAEDSSVSYPCAKSKTSRWAPVDCSVLASATVSSTTEGIFANLVNAASASNTNPNLLDVKFLSSTAACDKVDKKKVGFKITDSAGQCWLNVHPDHLNVYDFTAWARNHPGNSQFRNPIKEFAEAGNSTLVFPYWHEMSRWQINKQTFRSVGRLGDDFNYYDVPVALRTPAFNEAVGFDPNSVLLAGSPGEENLLGTLICGSPNEVSNDASLGGSIRRGAFDSFTKYFQTTSDNNLARQKMIVWTQVALEADDQLRQRVAWALAQILVISPLEIDNGKTMTEIFLSYYDIFVRNAFGNYRDILKEVSYSPLMSDMLTYFQSQSTAFVWEKERNLEYADENFAREVMQLFTTGLYKLEKNGKKVLDNNGNAVQVYTNDDIVEYARVWTGFKLQLNRGNKEMDGTMNRIDPMQINLKWRDRFPKMGLDRKYIGDGVPLCANLPAKHFLVKGAVYRLLGNKSTAKLQQDPPEWAQDPKAKHFTLQSGVSNSLFTKLCGSINVLNCQFSSKVVLGATVPCTGNECFVDNVRTVEVADGIFYEYVRPPCVYQAFYDNAKLLVKRKSKQHATCADPRTQVASNACCPDGRRSTAFWNEQYWGERSLFATATERCDQKLCGQNLRPSCSEKDEAVGLACKENNKFWTNTECVVRVKIDPVGNAAIVHSSVGVDDSQVAKHVQENTKTFFRLEWNDIAGVENLFVNCEAVGICRKTIDGMCMCDVSVSDEQVFFDGGLPSSSTQILSLLHIGSFEPSRSGDGYIPNEVGNVTWYTTTGSLTSDSVVQVTDEVGVTRYRKNMKSTVSIVGTTLSFRNPVHFVGIEDEQLRDAHYETEAALDTYFYHPNTAPFLAVRFAQRFGISNPSPNYIERAVSAFQSGSFTFNHGTSTETFGSQKYGDMASMIACLLLDKEARAVVLDRDPSHGSLREPLIKVIGLMRSMNFRLFDHVPFVNFNSNIFDSIGQMAHEIPNVFSFFLPEYQPSGTIAQASLVAPEAQVGTGPRIIKLLNGLMSLIKYGLDPCYDGFGTQSGNERQKCGRFQAGQYDRSSGRLTYAAPVEPVDEIIAELSTLLTAGRLSSGSREIIKRVFSSEPNPSLALLRAQQLIVTTPEFHGTGIVQKSGDARVRPQAPPPSSKPYKAMVYVLLEGGADSFNMLAPHTCSATNSNGATLLEQYYSERTTIAITEDERARLITATGQPCEQFVIHEELEIVERLYKAGDLSFFVNAGVIDKKATKQTYRDVTKTQLFAHNTMQDEAQRVDPFDGAPGTGVLGRMCDILTDRGFNAKPITIQDASVATVGVPGKSTEPLFVSSKGTGTFNPTPRKESFDPVPYLEELNEATELHSSVFGETWSSKLDQALADNAQLTDVLSKTTNLTQSFVGEQYTERMKAVATMILSHKQRGTDRDVIFVKLGGWDHHQMLKSKLSTNFQELNQALTYFTDEMIAQGLWDNVSLVIASDFGRTLTANSGEGSDHGWAGNYFAMGGSVKGGQIHGQYPEDITEAGPYNLGRGRLMPTLSWESILNSAVGWMGVETDAELDYCLPNRIQTGTKLYTKEEVFDPPL